ncbi:MAG: SCO family protein [Pseudomonadota bacterium]
MKLSESQSKQLVFGLMMAGAIFVATLISFLLFSDEMPPRNLGGEDGKIGGEFTLQGYHGDVSLSDYRGKVVMMYFGFTSCREVCSISMSVIRNTLNNLTPQEIDDVQVILVSFDPERDTLKELAEYSKQYHSKIVGVTGSQKAIDTIIQDYGAYYKLDGIELDEIEKIDLDYAFRHSSRYYIINQQGEVIDAMRHSSTPNEILARIRTLI